MTKKKIREMNADNNDAEGSKAGPQAGASTPSVAPKQPQASQPFDKRKNGFDGYVYCLGLELYVYTFWFQDETVEVVLHGDIVSVNLRSLCKNLGIEIESCLPRLQSELGDDLYTPVALPGAVLVVVVLAAVPRLLVSLGDGTIKDTAKLALYERHLYPSLWAALPREVAERAAAWERGFSEEQYYLGSELVQEFRGGAPMIEYHREREAWVVDDWPEGISLPPMLQPRRQVVRQHVLLPPMVPPMFAVSMPPGVPSVANEEAEQ